MASPIYNVSSPVIHKQNNAKKEKIERQNPIPIAMDILKNLGATTEPPATSWTVRGRCRIASAPRSKTLPLGY